MNVVFVVFVLCLSQSMAQNENSLPGNYTRQKGYCMWYGQCGISPATKKPINCFYNGQANHTYTNTSREILWRLCPEFIQKDTGVCCDEKQLMSLDDGVKAAQQMMARCPACWKNFRQLYCQMTCSPDNSLFITPVSWVAKTKGLTAINYTVDPVFRNGLYNSCKDVVFPSDNKKIMNFLCGMPAAKCNPMKFLTFMGSPDLNSVSPFLIKYPVNTTTYPDIKAMNVPINPCNESVFEPYTNKTGKACSCQDCAESCSPLPPYIPPKKWEIDIGDIHFHLISFVTLLVYLAFLVVFISGSIVYYSISSKQPRFENGTGHPRAQYGWKRHPGKLAMLGRQMDHILKSFFTKWGTFCSRYPWTIIFLSFLFVVICALGLLKFTVVTDPVKLWSEPGSEARQEKDIFDSSFGPFYRTAQIIFSIKPGSKYNNGTCYTTFFVKDCKLTGPILRKELLFKILDVQTHLINMSVEFDDSAHNSSHITLQDICMKPLSPYNENCTVLSVLQYWQNDAKKLNKCVGIIGEPCMRKPKFTTVHASWGDHLVACANNPTAINDTTVLGLPCTSLFGGPVSPSIALGGYEGKNYTDARNLIVTFVIRNHLDDSKNKKAKAWEKKFLEYLKNYKDDDLQVAFMAERSIEDEIERESHADIYTIFVSYLIMFLYITLALGQVNQCDRLLIDSKISLAFGGIIIVLASVGCSLGIFSFANEPATLIIIEVVPFLVLAVGVDNIFILVQRFQRDVPELDEDIPKQIGRVLGEIAPSMLLTSTSEAVAFAFGALSSMPAVKVFSLYASVAVFCNFLLQLTCFVALLSLDARRQKKDRLDVFCWIRPIKVTKKTSNKHSLLYQFFETVLSPALLSKYVRPVVICFFTGLLAVSIICIPSIELGLAQSLSMPKDSYLITYFNQQSANLKIGPPVYFVLDNDKYPFQKREFQNKVCGVSGCDSDSLTQIAYNAYRRPEQTKIGEAVSSWLDDYFSWSDPFTKCCRILDYTDKNGTKIYAKNNTFCNASLTQKYYHCHSCLENRQAGLRPNQAQFNKYLPYFLKDNPEINCTKGGHAAYGDAVKLNSKGSANPVQISYFMGYHTILKDSNDYVDALKNARRLAKTMSKKTDSHVFAYSIFYVYYEQYLTIVRDSWINLLVCLAAIFVMTFLLMGFHIRIAFIVTFTVAMIVTDIMGMMYLWNIPLNAVSLVNLVMAVGISVEFCSHIARHFTMTPGHDRIERAKLALAHMGSSVFSGITLTKFGGILVLAFSTSQIFEVFYFRMYLGIVLYGASHGLLFLPVFLSYVGPECTRDTDTPHKNTSGLNNERSSLINSSSGHSEYGSGDGDIQYSVEQ